MPGLNYGNGSVHPTVGAFHPSRATTERCTVCSGRLHQLLVDEGLTRHDGCWDESTQPTRSTR